MGKSEFLQGYAPGSFGSLDTLPREMRTPRSPGPTIEHAVRLSATKITIIAFIFLLFSVTGYPPYGKYPFLYGYNSTE